MRILFDHGTPEPLIPFLTGHIVTTAKDAGWDKLMNGDLIEAAEKHSGIRNGGSRSAMSGG